MKAKTVNLYEFNELSDEAKENAREWYRNGNLDDEWWDCTFDDFHTIASALGFTIGARRNSKHPTIYFSGFWSQGDGACFEGTWKASDYNNERLVGHLGDLDKHPDAELVRISKAFRELSSTNPNLYGSIKHTGRYCHSHSVSISCEEWMETEDGDEDTCTAETEEYFTELSRDLMDWFYKRLKEEYTWLQSDEQVDESIQCNGYTFTVDGKRED